MSVSYKQRTKFIITDPFSMRQLKGQTREIYGIGLIREYSPWLPQLVYIPDRQAERI